jgi:hypothetical protein
MLWRKTVMSPQTPSTCFEKLHEDVLVLIVEAVATYNDLADLVLVSRKFARIGTPRLHNSIRIDVTCRSNRRLLQLLRRPNNKLTDFVRYLEIGDWQKASVKTILDLSIAFEPPQIWQCDHDNGSVVLPSSKCSAHKRRLRQILTWCTDLRYF